MNIYDPYLVVEDMDGLLILTVSKARKVLFAFAYTTLPIVIICLLPALFYFSDGSMPWWAITCFSVIAVIISLMLFFKRRVHNVTISDNEIRIMTERALVKKEYKLLTTEADGIYVSVYRGRGGGAFFRLYMKDKSSKEFLTIPFLFLKSENIRRICRRLEEITGLNISGDALATQLMNS